MTAPGVLFVRVTGNTKLGPMPATYASSATCPPSCPLLRGCYARGVTIAPNWKRADKAAPDSFGAALHQIAALPRAQMWRWGVAGDLPGRGERVNAGQLARLARANRGRRGYAYTHKRPTPANLAAIRAATAAGFAVNLSANNPAHADELAVHGLPVVCILPAGHTAPKSYTPGGRVIQTCPQVTGAMPDCLTCGACQSTTRRAIIGFPAHGQAKMIAEREAGLAKRGAA